MSELDLSLYDLCHRYEILEFIFKKLEKLLNKAEVSIYCLGYHNHTRICLGSPKAIEIAQKNIPAALQTLEQCIQLALTLDNSAIETFASQTKTLFEIIGPEAVQFVKEKAEVQHKLKDLYDQQQKLYTELGQKKGLPTSFFSIQNLDKLRQ